MSEQTPQTPFAAEIDAHKTAEQVSTDIVTAETLASSIDVRLRGGFITDCQLTSPTTGIRKSVLLGQEDISAAKITASHAMVPVGPSEGVGGQHGFPRWSDYHEFPLSDRLNGEKSFALQAKRSDDGLSLSKTFKLSESSLTTRTEIRSSTTEPEKTSMGEHLYFSLEDDSLQDLTIDGQTIDELLGEGSAKQLMEDQSADGERDGTLYLPFAGEATIHFPAGHDVKLSATFDGDSVYPLALWIWKRPGSPSICFEPIVGVEHLDADDTSGLTVPAYGNASLTTEIELL